MSNASSSPTVSNYIIWDNAGDEIWNESGSPVVTYCDVEDGQGDPGDFHLPIPR